MAAELVPEVAEELEAVSASFPEACRYNGDKRLMSVSFESTQARISLPSDYPASPPIVTVDPPVGVTKSSVDDLMQELVSACVCKRRHA